jgi:hypothetical protein
LRSLRVQQLIDPVALARLTIDQRSHEYRTLLQPHAIDCANEVHIDYINYLDYFVKDSSVLAHQDFSLLNLETRRRIQYPKTGSLSPTQLFTTGICRGYNYRCERVEVLGGDSWEDLPTKKFLCVRVDARYVYPTDKSTVVCTTMTTLKVAVMPCNRVKIQEMQLTYSTMPYPWPSGKR